MAFLLYVDKLMSVPLALIISVTDCSITTFDWFINS